MSELQRTGDGGGDTEKSIEAQPAENIEQPVETTTEQPAEKTDQPEPVEVQVETVTIGSAPMPENPVEPA